jgi:hypothetical protein
MKAVNQKWNLMLDDRNEPFPVLMAYDAVSMYANELGRQMWSGLKLN